MGGEQNLQQRTLGVVKNSVQATINSLMMSEASEKEQMKPGDWKKQNWRVDKEDLSFKYFF